MGKVAVPAEGPDLSSRVSRHLGRAPYFIIFDPEGEGWEAVSNPASTEARGAGIRAAAFLVNRGVEMVVADHCGPKAFSVFQAAGVKVARAARETVAEVKEELKEGPPELLEAPSRKDTGRGGR